MTEHAHQGVNVPPDSVGPFASSWRRRHLTADERVARGQAARQETPRSSHGRWEPAADRPDPVALLEEQAASRVPQMVPIRYGRMLASPFTFYRGGALIMAADLAATPVSGVTVQLCGDAHLSNFGLFGTPERQMLFDINDFDETLPGPWEWDVKRLAASFEIMGRDRGFSADDRRAVLMAGVQEYRGRMRRAAGMGSLDAWYEHFEAGMLLKMVRQEVRVKRVGKSEAEAVEEMVAKARTRDSTRVFAKRADEVGGELRIVADPPVIIPIEDLVQPGSEWENPTPLIKKLLSSYRRTLGRHHHPLEEYRYVHAAYKMVGVGSVGTRCYIMLLLGRDHNDPLFLQVKEAQASVLERFLGASTYPHHGERVVAGQRLMQAATDIFLGWQRIRGMDGVTRDYYVRQFQDWKGSADVDTLLVPGATLYARICGATLARAHARWGDRIAIASYLGKGDTFDRAIADFSAAYADQNEKDYNAFAAAVESGRLTAQTGVLGAVPEPEAQYVTTSDKPASTGKPSLAARIDEEKSHPLAWKTVAKRAATAAVAGIAIYLVFPAITEVFASWPRLSTLHPWWLIAAIAAEVVHFCCTFALQRLALRTKAWFSVITSTLAGNAITLIMPGGAAVGAAVQFRMLATSGMDTTETVGGLASFSLLGVGGLLALPVFALPVILLGAPVDRGLEHAALLGAVGFVAFAAFGAVVLTYDAPLRWAGRAAQVVANWVRRKRPPLEGLDETLLAQRNQIRAALGQQWWQALLLSAGRLAFDYLCLLFALRATGSHPRPSLILVAYAVAGIVGMIPLTPGGLGIVEASLTGLLVLADVNSSQAVLATLTYRIASYWVPLLAGPIAYGLFQIRYKKRAGRAAGGELAEGPVTG